MHCAPPPPPPSTAPPPSPIPLPELTGNDVDKATEALIGMMPVMPAPAATRARSTSQTKRPLGGAAAQRHRSSSQTKRAKLASGTAPAEPDQRQPKLSEKYFKEYAQNASRLLARGISTEEQFRLERGLDDRGILAMQRETLASVLARSNVSIAPRPDSKKGGPSK